MTAETDLHIDARMLVETVDSLDRDVVAYSYDEDLSDTLEADLIAWALIEEANRTLAIVRAELGRRLADAFPRDEEGHQEKRITVMGAGTFERHKKKDRTAWEKDDLLRAVLDSRVVDKETGEVREETPLDRVLACFNLPAPRVTALRERGIDADEFCHVELGDSTLQFVAVAPISESEAA